MSVSAPLPNYLIAFALLIILSGCMPSTRITPSGSCSYVLKGGDQILLTALHFSQWQYKLESIRAQLGKAGIKVLYTPEEEWNLRVAGVSNALDSTQHATLVSLGITHILLIHEASAKEGQLYSYETPYEVSLKRDPTLPYNSRQDESSDNVNLVLQLQELRTKQYYSIRVSTTVSGVEIRNDDGGISTVNGGGIDKARNVAIKKGIQKLLQDCN